MVFHPNERAFDVGALMRWWALAFLGAFLAVTPMYLNPFTGVNGMTLLGLGLLGWASYQLLRGERL